MTDRVAALETALLDVALSASMALRHAASYERTPLRAAIARAAQTLARDPATPQTNPLQLVAASLAHAEKSGVAWGDIVALVNREQMGGPR